ncbi:MAG: YtxH domain-containing protein [Chloroflexi bacterium]|nr:MAG: YtxH domain-containing protein [Chloroflexota bacterium]
MSKLPLVVGVAAGASVMYLLDPGGGSERRQRLRDQFERARDKVSNDEGRLTPKDLISRTKEVVSDVRNRLSNGYREDIVTEAKETAQEMASPGRWSMRTRIVAAGLGGGLAFYGLRRTSLAGLALISIGAGLMARAFTNYEILKSEDANQQAESTSRRTLAARGTSRGSRSEATTMAEQDVQPSARDLRDKAAEEETTAFNENPADIPSD